MLRVDANHFKTDKQTEMAERNVGELDEGRKPENKEIQWGILQSEREREMVQSINECLRIIDRNVKTCVDKFKANIITRIKNKYREREIQAKDSFHKIEQLQFELDELSLEDRNPTCDESDLINNLTLELEKENTKFEHSKPKLRFYIDRGELMETLTNNEVIEVDDNNISSR